MTWLVECRGRRGWEIFSREPDESSARESAAEAFIKAIRVHEIRIREVNV